MLHFCVLSLAYWATHRGGFGGKQNPVPPETSEKTKQIWFVWMFPLTHVLELVLNTYEDFAINENSGLTLTDGMISFL